MLKAILSIIRTYMRVIYEKLYSNLFLEKTLIYVKCFHGKEWEVVLYISEQIWADILTCVMPY